MTGKNDIINPDFSKKALPIDDLNAKIGVLTRREVEARILSPVIEALADTFGRDPVISVVQNTIIEIAREHDIHVIENKPVAWALYRHAEVDEYIPPQLYPVVAEVIFFIMKLEEKETTGSG